MLYFQMDSKSNPCFALPPFYPFFLFFFFFFLKTHLSLATDSLSLGQSLSGNQTLISKDGNFELGFFSPSTSNNNFYIGIWYKKLPTKTIVWVANRDAPIFDTSSAELKISDQGNLVLLDGSKSPIWSSSSTPSNSNATTAVLHDTSNLVLTNSRCSRSCSRSCGGRPHGCRSASSSSAGAAAAVAVAAWDLPAEAAPADPAIAAFDELVGSPLRRASAAAEKIGGKVLEATKILEEAAEWDRFPVGLKVLVLDDDDTCLTIQNLIHEELHAVHLWLKLSFDGILW